ncbi:hypothetical protein DXG03_006238 [Asterophora parasitica]|uniref:Peroxisomal ATPase PEX1 n=1 Tax=Asterophora parasitica TaxID=117018 RepID=A0A9P7G7Q3_9AGAR|nr:hypothetical protein DXG03_006238 [Asterophora parasitica]
MPIPDEQIFPHATGPAEALVAKHQEPQDLVFYAGWFCPFVQRGWIALEEKGIKYQYKEVNPYKKENHFLEINPKGLVPAVEYKGKAIYESLVILEFLEDAYPDHTPLLPSDPVERAIARIWVDFVSKSVVPAFQRLLQAQEQEKQDAAREELYVALRKFATEVKGPYFLGDEFSLVDVAIAPWVVRDYPSQEHRGYTREGASDAWARYASIIEKRESVVNTQSNLAIHLKLIPGSQKSQGSVEAYVGWTGMASASSLAHFNSTNTAEKGLETIEIDPQYAQGLGLTQGDLVEIGLLHDLPWAKSVATEPLTSDDWEIIEIHASHVESTLLSQVRVAKVGQEIDVWVMGRTRVRLRVVSLDPTSKGHALLLTTNTEVSIAPKLHRSDRRADTSGPKSKSATQDAPATTPERKPQKSNSQVLRVLPHRVSPVAPLEYSGSELVAYVSPSTFKQIHVSRHPTEKAISIRCYESTYKRLSPPPDPSSSASGPSPPPAPATRIIKPGAADKEPSNDAENTSADVIFVGALHGLPEGHIVFPAVPRNVEDWDLLLVSSSAEGEAISTDATRGEEVPEEPSSSMATSKTTLAGVDETLERCTNFCIRTFVSHSYTHAVHGVSALLVTGRPGTGKTSIIQHVAKCVQEDQRAFTYTHFVDVSPYAEQPIPTIKSLLLYWFGKALWHKPSILILDNLDKLIGAEVEHADSFRARHITEIFLSIYSSSARTAIPNSRGVLLIAAATSTASIHPLVSAAHVFHEVINVKPPNSDARRDILESIVRDRLNTAQDIQEDEESPLNYTSLATQTEGYSATDLQDLVARAIHQVAIRAANNIQPAVLSSADFTAAQVDFTPLSLRDVKLQKSDTAWSDIGGTRI